MKPILDDIHDRGYATIQDHPTLVETHVQEQLAKVAEAAGLIFSVDTITKTATFVRQSKDPRYGPRERVTLLNAWLFLVFRAKTNVTIEQDDRWLRLTPEGRQAMRQEQEMTLTPGRLHNAFPNLYPKPEDAQTALTILAKKGLLRSRDEDGNRSYLATPLLSHVVNEDEAINLVFGHLRGEYNHLMPKELENASLDAEVLQIIKNLPDGSASSDTIATRLGKSRRVVQEQLAKLKEAGLVTFDHKGRGGSWHVTEKDAEETS